jgi:hypothetical protein
MVRTFLKVYMELGSFFLFLQEQIKDIIIIMEFKYLLFLQEQIKGIITVRRFNDEITERGGDLEHWLNTTSSSEVSKK